MNCLQIALKPQEAIDALKEALQAVKLSAYSGALCPITTAESTESMLKYIASISSALALLNMVPVPSFDGHMTATSLAALIVPGFPHIQRGIVAFAGTLGLVLFAANVAMIIVQVVLSST